MTGIERLHEFAAGISPVTSVCGVTKTAYDRKHMESIGVRLRDFLTDIADQIERERACDGDTAENIRLIVGGVVDEMERHILGHEGMEDSPVARWARELREALTKNEVEKMKCDPAEDVSMSAYDLLPEEDRDAIAWVREHGGLDEVRRRWECLSYYADPVPRSCMEKRLARLQRQIDESHAALRRRNARIGFLVSELNRANHENHEEFMRRTGDYTAFTDEVCKRLAPELRYVEGCTRDVMDAALAALDRRLMPEGMEWPRFEDGEPVRPGNRLLDKDGDWFEAGSFVFTCDWWSIRGYQTEGFGNLNDKTRRKLEGMAYGTCVKRPVADTWGRLEEDAKLPPLTYCIKRGIADMDATDADNARVMATDLVRRAKALAGDA